MKKKVKHVFYKLTIPQSLLVVGLLTFPVAIWIAFATIGSNRGHLFGILALAHFILSFLLYPLLIGISRSAKKRKKWLPKLVSFTRIFNRLHPAFGILGAGLVLLHAALMLENPPVFTTTVTEGILALAALLIVLTTGYFRRLKASGLRRRIHRYMAILFLFFVFLHILG